MDSITVKNFRCFGEQQTVPLAPLTLLVGDNSTGKTSFLALIRALWDVAYGETSPNFKEPPYDLGSYSGILHNRGRRGRMPKSFEAKFVRRGIDELMFSASFENIEGIPYPTLRRVEGVRTWVELRQNISNSSSLAKVRFGTEGSENEFDMSEFSRQYDRDMVPFYFATAIAKSELGTKKLELSLKRAQNLVRSFDLTRGGTPTSRPHSTAPIRSRPARTYDPTVVSYDPEGGYVPTYLARASTKRGRDWKELHARLVEFGVNSGLFDDMRVHHLGKDDASPFQIQVLERGRRRGDSYRNIVDIGYGISQALPILTEMLRLDGPNMFLLQQPEVHLHPSAQAALGTLFCEVASSRKQIIVETHSEYIVDRIRMDVRDQRTKLRHHDVCVLYFERDDANVNIHPIHFDEMGNVMNAPEGYGKFFMDEVNRSLGI